MSYGTKRGAKTVLFTVEGTGEFPIDMFRYDACYPATERDSYVVEDKEDGRRRVVLKHRVSKDEVLTHYPTEERWRSFLWTVVPNTIEYDKL